MICSWKRNNTLLLIKICISSRNIFAKLKPVTNRAICIISTDESLINFTMLFISLGTNTFFINDLSEAHSFSNSLKTITTKYIIFPCTRKAHTRVTSLFTRPIVAFAQNIPAPTTITARAIIKVIIKVVFAVAEVLTLFQNKPTQANAN